MEMMKIDVLFVAESNDCYQCSAVAMATNAKIYLTVRFPNDRSYSKRQLWERARHEMLRYLDPC
jgi:hypothetical protein